MYKIKGWLVIVLTLALIMGTTGVALAQKPIVIGAVPFYLDRYDSFMLYLRETERRLKELGVDYRLITRAPAGGAKDHIGQLAIIEDMVAMGVDYLAMLPTSIEMQIPAFGHVIEAGIPLIITDYLDYIEGSDVPETDQEYFIAYSHSDMGKAVADYVKENYRKGVKMAIIHGIPGHITNERAAEHLHIANGVNIIYRHWADFDRAKAYAATLDVLVAHPDVEIILGMNSTMAIGVVAAVEAMGRLDDIDVIGYGGIIEELNNVALGRMITVARSHFHTGKAMADIIYLHSQGFKDVLRRSIRTPCLVLDSAQAIRDKWDHRYLEMMREAWPADPGIEVFNKLFGDLVGQ
ncbi:sugar ABC transporter substrate-binding protein [Candidatus Aerophobetes bacterium]|nr:sugar ABC transporter substrate-binding protein [Candidatus Aerophobetes bacterium]